jgi:hypothetical protein
MFAKCASRYMYVAVGCVSLAVVALGFLASVQVVGPHARAPRYAVRAQPTPR